MGLLVDPSNNGRRPLKTVYLDQNKWIDLARLHYSPGDTDARRFVDTLRQMVRDRKCVLPISYLHVMETQRHSSLDRRRRLSAVMTSFSQGCTLPPHTFLVKREIERALCRIFDRPVPELAPRLGRGINFAFGEEEQLHLHLGMTPERAEALMKFIDNPKHFEELLTGDNSAATVATNQILRTKSFDQSSRIERARSKLRSQDLDTRRRCYVAELTIDMYDVLAECLRSHGVALDTFLGIGTERLMAFWADVPTMDVEIELAVLRDSQWHRKIDPNDSYDIGFLCVAIPYCDIVVTEKFWVHNIERLKLHNKYGTAISSSVSEVMELVEA